MLKAPDPDPGLEAFREMIAVLRRDGEVAGHVASTVSTFWSPAKPLSRQWWVWFVVVWSDGDRERAFEDYPPWTFVSELQSGTFVWDEEGAHKGTYSARLLAGEEEEFTRAALNIRPEDF